MINCLEMLDSLEVLDVGVKVLENGLKKLNDSFEIYDQLFPNNLAELFGIELLKL